ncbi:7063_t:CDS:2, partial [Scutellospora calospora]
KYVLKFYYIRNIRLRVRGIEEEEISTGFVVCSTKRPVKTTTMFEAQLAILEHKNIICAGYSAVLHIHSCVEEVSIAALLHLVDKKTGRKSKRPPQYIKKGQKVIARLETQGPICVEVFEEHSQLGRFTLRDEDGLKQDIKAKVIIDKCIRRIFLCKESDASIRFTIIINDVLFLYAGI